MKSIRRSGRTDEWQDTECQELCIGVLVVVQNESHWLGANRKFMKVAWRMKVEMK